MRPAIAYVVLAAAGLAAAQDKEQQTPVEEFDIVPGDVELVERGSWCMGERNTCEALCPGPAKANRCNIDTLEYTCTCANGTEPGLKYYDSSLYSKICQEAFRLCSETNAGNPLELPKCKDDIQSKCGTLNISEFEEADEDDEDKKDDGDKDDSDDSDKPKETEDSDDEADDESDDDASAASRAGLGTAAVFAAMGALTYFL